MNKKIKYWITVCFVLIISTAFINVVSAGEEEKIKKEKIHKLRIISSDLVDREIPEVQIDEEGKITIWISINVTYCGMDNTFKTYYISPEGSENVKLNYSSKIFLIDDCNPRMYFETAEFDLLEANLSKGVYNLYRTYNGIPLYMNKIHIRGDLPRAVPAGSEEINMTLLNRLISLVIEFLDYIKKNYFEQAFEPQLAVTTVKWIRIGEEWDIYANYTDKRGRPVMNGYCKLNTDKWGVLDMNYDNEKKVYFVSHIAEPVGIMRWTVACY